MKNNLRATRSTDVNVAQTHDILDTQGYNAHSEYVIFITFTQQEWLL